MNSVQFMTTIKKSLKTGIRVCLLTVLAIFVMIVIGDGSVHSNVYAESGPYSIVGGSSYSSLSDAIKGVQEGDTIKLNDNTEESEVFPVRKSFTLDLNGHTLTMTGSSYFFLDGIELNVTDCSDEGTGKILSHLKTDSGSLFVLAGSAKLTVSGGSYYLCSDSKAWHLAYEYSGANSITINGGTFVTENSASSMQFFVDADSALTINDGIFVCSWTFLGGDGEATLNGGYYKLDSALLYSLVDYLPEDFILERFISGPYKDYYKIIEDVPTQGWSKGNLGVAVSVSEVDGGWEIRIVPPEGDWAWIDSVEPSIGSYDFPSKVFTVGKVQKDTMPGTGRPIFGDIYTIKYRTGNDNEGRNENGTLRVNLRVTDDISSPVDTTQLENALVAAYDMGVSDLRYSFKRTTELPQVVTVGSIGSLNNEGTVWGATLDVIELAESAFSEATAMYNNPTNEAEVIAAAEKLETAMNNISRNYQENFVKFVSADKEAQSSDGKTVKVSGIWDDAPDVYYIKGIYKSRPAGATLLDANRVTLSTNGVYSFFVDGDYSVFNISKVYYVVVGEYEGTTTDDSLVQAVKDTLTNQLGASEQDIFTSDTKDLQELIDMGFAYIDKNRTPEEKPNDPDPIEPIDNPSFDDYVDIKVNAKGNFEWSSKNGASILGMSYAIEVADSEKETASYYPLMPNRNSVPALASATVHTFKAVVRVNGNIEVYYYDIKSGEFNTPAVVVFSSTLGVFRRGSNTETVAYIQGIVADVDAAKKSAANIYYVPISDGGVMLDKSVFGSGEYTFFFFNTRGEYVTQTIVF